MGRAKLWALLAALLAMGCAEAEGVSADESPDASAGGAAGSVSTGGSAGASGGNAGQAGLGGTASGGAAGGGGSAGADPCIGTTCNTPPKNTCADAISLTVYSTVGTCSAGKCAYASQQELCKSGCKNDACDGDPCVGVSCNTAPKNTCADANNLTVYDVPGSCSGGQCAYTSHKQYCSFSCANDVCNGDPCIGVSCKTPPASYCSGATELTVYDAPGTCGSGQCSYGKHTVFCSFGCALGACANDPCAGVACSTPPAPYCSGPNTLKTPASSGTCQSGSCSYPTTDANCPFGCSNGVCKDCSTTADCSAGKWCDAGTCKTCNNDAHCGASCANCTSTTQVCNAGGTACVACTADGHCGAGKYCSANTCLACDTNQKCGATCAACATNQQCSAAACQVCKTNTACGANCAACGGGTPLCLDQGTTSKCVQCLTDANCTGGQVCKANVCGPPGCPPPTEACSNGNQNRDKCSGARIIGRIDAGDSNGFTISDNTCYAYNRLDDSGSCYDAGADHTYRIYLRAGESMAVTLTDSWACPSYSSSFWDATIKIFSNSGCNDLLCTNKDVCDDYFSGTKNYVAAKDGWYIIVVDGSTAFDDEGDYTLKVKLTCGAQGCTCS
ncbi:MAG: hypothetical protein IPI67_39380 [Myxococcales bacterium]|nr:hypothetical protein [Myxococcales bacterium]